MPITATDYVNSNYAVPTMAADRVPTQTMNQDDFLKLLITQMTSQDPLNPKSDLDTAAQMAQFTSLEQTRTMSGQFAILLGQQQVLQANSLLGRTVDVLDGSGSKLTGTVDAIDFATGEPKVVVNGNTYTLGQVVNISTAPPPIAD